MEDRITYRGSKETPFEEIYIKFELYTENGDCGTDTHTVCSGKFIPLEYDSLLIDELYEYFSAIRKKCIEKWNRRAENGKS